MAVTAGAEPESALVVWERRAEWPLIAVSAAFLACYAWQVLHVSAAPGLREGLETAM